MKKSAIIRIVFASIAIVILTSVLVLGLSGGFSGMMGFSFGGMYSYADYELYSAGDASVATDGIERLDIGWIAGGVNITTHNGSEILVSESNSDRLEEDEKLRYLVKNGVLYVKYWAPRKFFSVKRLVTPGKQLTVSVPESKYDLLNTVDIDTVSARIELSGIAANEFKLNSVSGAVSASLEGRSESISAKTVSGAVYIKGVSDYVELNSVSGGLMCEGEIVRLKGKNVSGAVTANLDNCPENVSIGTVSGSIRLTIPDNEGFTASYSFVSGAFNSSFATVNSKDQAVYGNGNAKFEFNAVSGSVTVNER